LLNKQNPIAVDDRAWCPGGLLMQMAFFAFPEITKSTAWVQAPAALNAAW
jgi:hypothetical protein